MIRQTQHLIFLLAYILQTMTNTMYVVAFLLNIWWILLQLNLDTFFKHYTSSSHLNKVEDNSLPVFYHLGMCLLKREFLEKRIKAQWSGCIIQWWSKTSDRKLLSLENKSLHNPSNEVGHHHIHFQKITIKSNILVNSICDLKFLSEYESDLLHGVAVKCKI